MEKKIFTATQVYNRLKSISGNNPNIYQDVQSYLSELLTKIPKREYHPKMKAIYPNLPLQSVIWAGKRRYVGIGIDGDIALHNTKIHDSLDIPYEWASYNQVLHQMGYKIKNKKFVKIK